MSDPGDVYDSIRDEVGKVLIGNEDVIENLTIAVLTRGHILLEGVPGVAKTTMANLFARATGLSYNRIQMTPDILPADILGTRIYRDSAEEFQLQRGPVFSNVVVADEINRATPKTQSALLEAMEERNVSIEGQTLPLPQPFIVIATQNPIEMEGTFALPEAQRDRFQLKLTVELPTKSNERMVLERFDERPELGEEAVSQVTSSTDLTAARQEVEEVYVDPKIYDYILELVRATRDAGETEYGASPRASLSFLHTGKARAAIKGREYVIPDDIKALAEPVLVHRLILSADAELSDTRPSDVVESVINSVEPPEVTVSAPDGRTDT